MKKGKWSKDEVKVLEKNFALMTNPELAKKLDRSIDSVERKMYRLGLKKSDMADKNLPVEQQVEIDEVVKAQSKKTKVIKKKYQYLLDKIDILEKERSVVYRLSEKPHTISILPEVPNGSEATAFIIASDWHYEETVKSEVVSGLNKYNLNIAHQRITKFFQGGLRLYDLMRKDVKIKNIVLALLGDFITGNIHEEFLETCSLQPMDAIWEVYEEIVSGIDFLLKNSDANLIIPCVSGNHPRITKQIHYSTESGNSIEYFMYRSIAKHYEGNKRVQVKVAKGYHCYLDIYGKVIRFHHGHAIRYGGGVGGITIPVNKAIAQWNKARHADLDIFGHFHQLKDNGNWICNGSIIGYNAFALRIKADYETARQSFFLFDKSRGLTITAPILVNGK